MGFSTIIGQDLIITALKRSIQNNELAHAYLFSGPSGSGKKTIATLFAQALNCRDQKEPPCQNCLSCHKISNSNHPDVYYLKPEGASLKIEQVREIKEDLYFFPVEGVKKVCIIEEAELLTLPAANSLLKILEEPPQHLLFVLLCARPSALLPTIISRCAHFSLKPLTVEEMVSIIKSNVSLTPEETEIIAALAGGNPGKGLEMALDGHWFERYRTALGLIAGIESGPPEDIFNLAEDFSKREDAQKLLELMLIIYRDRLLYALAGGADHVFVKNPLQLNAGGEKDSNEQYPFNDALFLEKICNELLKMQVELSRNVNRRLAYEVLFLKMRGVV